MVVKNLDSAVRLPGFASPFSTCYQGDFEPVAYPLCASPVKCTQLLSHMVTDHTHTKTLAQCLVHGSLSHTPPIAVNSSGRWVFNDDETKAQRCGTAAP